MYIFNIAAVFFSWIFKVYTQQHTEGIGHTSPSSEATSPIITYQNMSSSLNSLPEVLSYTEEFIRRLAGRKINVKKLILEYSLVCPVKETCGVYGGHFPPMYDIPSLSECKTCTCDQTCLVNGNCCPGTHFGYLHYECLNTFLYPKEMILSSYMADHCLESYTANKTLTEQCASQYRPCSSFESGLIYKNTFCAKCNYENNCIPWKLNVDCPSEQVFQGMFKSVNEVKALIDEYNCTIQYQYSGKYNKGCNNRDYFSMNLIDRCNVTGLWQLYDADTEWACENFIQPYKVFKNIFCYICNPSRGNNKDVALIKNCSLPANSTESFMREICKSYPVSDRMKPFKNKYCYACSKGQEMLENSMTDVISLSDISEKNDPSTLETQLSFSLVFHTDNSIKELEHFVHELMAGTFDFVEHNTEHKATSKTYYNFSSFGDIINQYISVCGKTTLCNETGTHTGHIYGNPVCGECTCDSVCAELDNCCPNTIISKQPYSCLKTEAFPSLSKSAKENQEWYDEPAHGNNSYNIIDTCIEERHPLSHKCSSYGNAADILSSTPISTSAPVTYRNIYCYACNNNKSNFVLNIQAYCETYFEHELFTDISVFLREVKLYCPRISFIPVKGRQCLKYDHIKASFVGGRKYVRKEMNPSKFEFGITETKKIRVTNWTTPVKAVYSICNQTGYLQDYNAVRKEVCENETVNIMSIPEYRFEERVYKNFACFLCNPDLKVSETDLSNVTSDCLLDNSTEWYEQDESLEHLCRVTDSEQRWVPYKNMYCAECNLPPWQRVDVVLYLYDQKSPKVYSYLFSLSPDDFERLDKASEADDKPDCPGGTYDFSLNQCRLLHCNEGYELFNATCKPVLETVSNHNYNISFRLERTENDGIALFGNEFTGNTNLTVGLNDLCLKTVEMITNTFEPTVNFFIRQIHCRVSSVCLFSDKSTLKKKIFFDISRTNFIEVTAIIEILYTESVTMVRRSLINALNRSYHLKNLINIDGCLQSVYLRASQTNIWKRLELNASCVFITIYHKNDLPLSYHLSSKVDTFLLCPYVKFNLSEVSFEMETLSVFLNKSGFSFAQGEYKIMGNFLIICADDYFIRKGSNTFSREVVIDPFDDIQKLLNNFTLVCTVTSLVCLFLTFIVYSLFSSMRTIPGKCVMLLCFSLFVSQFSLQFGLQGYTNKSTICIVIGICIHYFWIAAFCAMHICSIHTFKVFYLNECCNDLIRNQRRLFNKYLLYFVFLPLTLVLATVLLSWITSVVSIPGYGENYCFISDFYIFVGTFLTPACLILLSNVVFFSLTFHKIRTSPNIQSNQERKNFYIFLRLCTIVGIAWPLLIIDSVLDSVWFSFVVSGIISLQGVFIFVSFILNRRVLSLCASLCKKDSGQKTTTTRSS